MIMMFMSLMLILNSASMFFFSHPLSMGLMILIQTIITCMISGMLIKTYWFSYILFLTFLGGLLVLFIYVSSIASNELFFMNFKMKMSFLFILPLILLISIMFNFNSIKWNYYSTSEMINSSHLPLLINDENKINLSKLYNNQTFLLMFMLIIYLFITLVAVVKITNIFFGPLRISN